MGNISEKERKNNELAEHIAHGLVNLGYGYIPTQEERVKIEKRRKRIHKREAFFENLRDIMRPVIFTPLSVVFHIISFVTKGIGYISSVGLIAGFYYLYKSIEALINGVPFGEIDTFVKAVAFIIIPFAAFGISVVTERIYCYFENNAY